jgi:hypothetical protein
MAKILLRTRNVSDSKVYCWVASGNAKQIACSSVRYASLFIAFYPVGTACWYDRSERRMHLTIEQMFACVNDLHKVNESGIALTAIVRMITAGRSFYWVEIDAV